MTVIKAFQHDPLGRQCAESHRIKSIDPSKRINNRKEYHQPGDVEVRYEKNESDEMKKKRKMIKERKQQKRLETRKIDAEKSEKAKEIECEKKKSKENVSATTVEKFIRQMRRHTEIEETNTVAVEEDVCSTQNMIQDARARKRGNIHQQCDICEYSTAVSYTHLTLPTKRIV